MGDIADYLVEQMTNAPHRSMFSRFTARPPLHCRHCGALCYWGSRSGEWALMEAGAVHKCREDDLHSHAVSGFEQIK